MAKVARRQHGVVTLAQLRACGFTDEVVRGLVRRGEVRRLHRAVFLVGPMVGAHTRELAATLACGAGAVASHRSAARLYAILPPAPGPVHVTVAGRHVGGDDSIVVHRTHTLRRHEVRDRHGIPVTAPIRTIVDLAGACRATELEAAVAEAFALNLVNRAVLLRAIDSSPGRRGVARLARILEGERRPARTRSHPERLLLSAIRRSDLPEPEVNARIGPWEVDFLWRDLRLVVEVDGYSTHSSPRAFERDRRKDGDLLGRGFIVRRFTANQVRNARTAVIGSIRSTIDQLHRPPSVVQPGA